MILFTTYNLYSARKWIFHNNEDSRKLRYISRKNRKIALYTVYTHHHGGYIVRDGEIKYIYDTYSVGCNTQFMVRNMSCILQELPFKLLNGNIYRYNCDKLVGCSDFNITWKHIYCKYFCNKK